MNAMQEATRQIPDAVVDTDEMRNVLRELLEELRHAQTIADVAIAAGIAYELLNLLS